MSATLLCRQCGAPWQPDVTGACRFCHVVALPSGAPTGVAGARPTIDPDALFRLLWAMAADPSHPLDRLADSLRSIAGDRFTASGKTIDRLQLTLDDWQYQAWIDHGEVVAMAVHTVRGVVLKREPLPYDDWVACVAGDLADYASTHRHVYDAIVALDRAAST